MPARSKQQFKFFQWMGHDPEAAKAHGFTEHKAQEFTAENVGDKSYNKLPKIVNKPKRFHSLFKGK